MFSFFFGSPLGFIIGLITSVIMILVVLVLITGALAFTGGPAACTPGGGAIEVNDAQAQSFDQKWCTSSTPHWTPEIRRLSPSARVRLRRGPTAICEMRAAM